LGRYAWYSKNSQDKHVLPVGSLKPNDFGLFDMLGNACEWVQAPISSYPKAERGESPADAEDTRSISDRLSRVLRGGAFTSQPMHVRSANCYWSAPTTRSVYRGFRPARGYR
jgi:formylglycine-generating enzyme required for sulfatase activity